MVPEPGRRNAREPAASAGHHAFTVGGHPTAAAVRLPYVLKRSRRKTLCLIVRADGIVEVRSPMRLQQDRIDAFVRDKAGWIEKKLQGREAHVQVPLPHPGEYAALAHETARLAARLADRFVSAAALKPARVSIGRQKSRWGSCNSRGQIRFNACLARLPEPLAEYVVAHELCHLVHLNHSSQFYALLQQLLPDARLRQRDLKRYQLVDPPAQAAPLQPEACEV